MFTLRCGDCDYDWLGFWLDSENRIFHQAVDHLAGRSGQGVQLDAANIFDLNVNKFNFVS